MTESNYKLPDPAQERKRGHQESNTYVYRQSEELKQLGRGRTYCIRTYGCQANQRDSETIAGMLNEMEFKKTDSAEQADLIIFNTCAIRQAAEDHVIGEIGNLKPLKEMHPDKIFILCGCMAQEESVVRKILRGYPQVDLIFGTHNVHRFPELLARAMDHERTIEVENAQTDLVEEMPAVRSSAHKGFVSIMYGCDKFCTYCIVPYTRGRQQSRRMEYIIHEVEQMKRDGYREVTLLGQNVNAYGKDLGMNDGFTELLKACAGTGIDRIRFYSSHPRDYTVSSIEAMRDHPNIMKALHLPVQSGSTEVLKRMNRGYTVDHYKALYDGMKARIPDLVLTTDLIVGFPGETEAQFQETLDLVDYCQFDAAYTFAFSPREGTPASSMAGAIPEEVKKRRLAVLNERIGKYARLSNERYVGHTVEVLCDGPSKKDPDILAGYSRENKLVNFTGSGIQAGDLVQVEITEAKSFTLDGKAL